MCVPNSQVVLGVRRLYLGNKRAWQETSITGMVIARLSFGKRTRINVWVRLPVQPIRIALLVWQIQASSVVGVTATRNVCLAMILVIALNSK